MCKTGYRAWYSPKLGTNWDLTWSTKLPVFTWHALETTTTDVTGGPGVTTTEIHGFVLDPADVGTSGGLVPADSITIMGADRREQFFLTYVPDDEDEACRYAESLAT